MMWMVLKLLGIGHALVGWIVAAAAWLFADWRRLAGLALIVVFVVMALQIRSLNGDLADETKRANAAEADFELLKEQHYSFVADVQAKTAQAARLDKVNAARVERRMQQIKERTANEYEGRLADTRNALERLHNRIRTATSAGSEGNGGATDMSGYHTARCEAFGYSDCDTLLAALPELLAAAEDNTGKLIALQQWTHGILTVDLGGGPDPSPD